MINFILLALQEAQQMAESSSEIARRAVLESLHRVALTVLESPKSEREAIYEIIRSSLDDTRQTLNLSHKEMADFEDKYITWLRALVDMIERSGGAQGGKA